MDPNVTAAIIGSVVSIIVVFLTNASISWNDFRSMRKKEDRIVKLDALSPLRTYASESYVRFRDIEERIAGSKNKGCHLLVMEENIPSMSEWGRNDGCYLISTCYFIACLFCYLYRAKAAISYLNLQKNELGRLITLISDVTISFSRDGMYYGIQLAIGSQMYDDTKNQVISYREFCEKLDDSAELAWFEQLLVCCNWLGKGFDRRDEYLAQIIDALECLSEHLDGVIGDCFFLAARKEGNSVRINPNGKRRYS